MAHMAGLFSLLLEIYVTCVPKHGMPYPRWDPLETGSEADNCVIPAGK